MKLKIPMLLFGMALLAHAESNLSFGFMPSDNSFGGIWWEPDDGPGRGGNVYVTSVFGHVDTIFEEACLSCLFSMNFGTLVSFDLATWSFSGGTFTIVGGVDGPANIPEFLSDDSQPTLASGTFTDTPMLSFVSYDSLLDMSTLRFDAKLTGNLLPQLADAFGFAGSGLGDLFFTMTVTSRVFGGDSFQADTLLSGQLTFNGLPQTPEPSPVILLTLVAPLLYFVIRRRGRATST
jgi:hypothetical protein